MNRRPERVGGQELGALLEQDIDGDAASRQRLEQEGHEGIRVDGQIRIDDEDAWASWVHVPLGWSGREAGHDSLNARFPIKPFASERERASAKALGERGIVDQHLDDGGKCVRLGGQRSMFSR
jgi:hypothetical protein